MFAALIATATFAGDRRLVVDERAVGLAVAAVLVWRRALVLVVIMAAALATALVRAMLR